MTNVTDNDRRLIANLWTAMATARAEYWSDRCLNRVIDLIAWRMEGDATIEQLGRVLIQERERAARELGVPPWNG